MIETTSPTLAIAKAVEALENDDNRIIYLIKDTMRSTWGAIRTWLPEDCWEFFACPDNALVCYFTARDIALVMTNCNAPDVEQNLLALAEKVAISIDSLSILSIIPKPEGSKEPS